jgi:acetyl-CoA carboxylase biotin carboxyl carrier protein
MSRRPTTKKAAPAPARSPEPAMSKHDSDLDLIRKLAQLANETNMGEIEYALDGRKIRVARAAAPAAPQHVTYASAPAPASAPAAAPAAAAPAPPADDSNHPGVVKSPMVGTAYLFPEPGKPAFVTVGDVVTLGQTLLIIEAMKTFNPIKATKAGKVTKIIIGNAQPVEFGEPMMIVE